MSPTEIPEEFFNSTFESEELWDVEEHCLSKNISNCYECLSSDHAISCRWSIDDNYCYNFKDIPDNTDDDDYLHHIIECPQVYITISLIVGGLSLIWFCLAIFCWFKCSKKSKKRRKITSTTNLKNEHHPSHKRKNHNTKHYAPVRSSKSDVRVTYDAYESQLPITDYQPTLRGVVELEDGNETIELPKRHSVDTLHYHLPNGLNVNDSSDFDDTDESDEDNEDGEDNGIFQSDAIFAQSPDEEVFNVKQPIKL